MGRAWQIEYEGGLYHVLSRGNEMSGKIFFMMTGIAWFIHYARCDTIQEKSDTAHWLCDSSYDSANAAFTSEVFVKGVVVTSG